MMTSLKKSKTYWDARAKAEKVWQESAKKDMEKYNQRIVSMYNQTIADINRQIKADLALSEGKLIKADSMKEYESLAKRAVDKANALRAKGKHVTRKDFMQKTLIIDLKYIMQRCESIGTKSLNLRLVLD